jgi:hypothetical protein
MEIMMLAVEKGARRAKDRNPNSHHSLPAHASSITQDCPTQ